jgi:molybdopterin-containing oxidoreductase family iron-sulfur binding subunit
LERDYLGASSWSKTLHDGYFSLESSLEVSSPDFSELNLEELRGASASGMSLVLYTKTGMGDGQQANNPWLQEFPDPITRVSWDNYLTISMSDAKALGLKNTNTADGALNGSYASVTVGSQSLKVQLLFSLVKRQERLAFPLVMASEWDLKMKCKRE